MATKEKKLNPARKGKKGGKGGKAGSNDHAYVRLRTVLDSLEIGAIRYFASAPTSAKKHQRMLEIEGKLMPILQWLWAQPDGFGVLGIDCPEGYTDCHGVCVPYPCPDV